MNITFLTTAYLIIMNIMLALTIIKMLLHTSVQKDIKLKVYAIFGIWIAGELLFLGKNSLIPVGISDVSLFVVILIFVVIAGIFLVPIFKTLVSLPQEFILLPQAFRMFFGAGFLIEAGFGIIPLEYGVIDGILHITTAFLATTLAIYIAHGFKVTRSIVLINLFGLLDIVIVAFGIAFFILKDIGVDHNVFYAVFFAAPIFIWLHLISLYKVFIDSKKEIL